MKSLWLAITALVLVSCGTRDEGPTDRAEAPVAAFNAARAALHRRDLPGYFDALSDEAVRGTLSNSLGICLMSNKPETKGRGYNPSKGCELILEKHGWVEPTGLEPSMMRAAWSKALLEISDPRAMASELERNHRAEGAGSSFVWEYLDPCKS